MLEVKCSGGSTTSVPTIDTTPAVGLWPNNPQNAAGVRIDPPVSEPTI